MTDKVIFLDVDGPLCSVRAYVLTPPEPWGQSLHHSTFDPIAVAYVNKLLEQVNGLQIVVSSTWRIDGYEACKHLFEKNGISSTHFHKDWATPQNVGSRSEEIRGWLDNHPEVTRYVAIDDEALDPDLVEWSVRCDTYDGWSHVNYLEAQHHLKVHDHLSASIASMKNFSLRRHDYDSKELQTIADKIYPKESLIHLI